MLTAFDIHYEKNSDEDVRMSIKGYLFKSKTIKPTNCDMNKQQLFENIKRKKSFLCVGLDTDIKRFRNTC